MQVRGDVWSIIPWLAYSGLDYTVLGHARTPSGDIRA